MKTKKIILLLSLPILLLSSIIPFFASFPFTESIPVNFTSARGEEILLYGTGTYQYDSVFHAGGMIAQDRVVLFLGMPLFLLGMYWYLKDRPGGNLLLLAILGFFTYASASQLLGASYNSFFMFYVALFSISLFSLIYLFANIYFPTRIVEMLPRKAPAVFFFISGLITLFLWGFPLTIATLNATIPPYLYHYTTTVTHGLDLAIIFPASMLAGVYILHHNSIGYKIAFPLLGIIIFLVPVIILSTYIQIRSGINFTTAEIVGPITGFLLLGFCGIWIGWVIIKRIRIHHTT